MLLPKPKNLQDLGLGSKSGDDDPFVNKGQRACILILKSAPSPNILLQRKQFKATSSVQIPQQEGHLKLCFANSEKKEKKLEKES